MPAPTEVTIPEYAECQSGYGAWVMRYAASGRFELRFRLQTPGELERRLVVAFRRLVYLLYACYAAFAFWRMDEMDDFGAFIAVSLVWFLAGRALQGGPGLRMQELVIDRTTKTMTITGLVGMRQETVTRPFHSLRKLTYIKGAVGARPTRARICMEFAQVPNRIDLGRLGLYEHDLLCWISEMVGYTVEIEEC